MRPSQRPPDESLWNGGGEAGGRGKTSNEASLRLPPSANLFVNHENDSQKDFQDAGTGRRGKAYVCAPPPPSIRIEDTKVAGSRLTLKRERVKGAKLSSGLCRYLDYASIHPCSNHCGRGCEFRPLFGGTHVLCGLGFGAVGFPRLRAQRRPRATEFAR